MPVILPWLISIVIADIVPVAEITAGEERQTSLQSPGPAYLAIVIDDLGNEYSRDIQSVHLPGPVACAMLPRTPYAAELAEAAHLHGKEVILHQPMEPLGNQDPGPGALFRTTGKADFVTILMENLASIPHVSGVNNHMGSLLTGQTQQMGWMMKALQKRGELFFVDSRTDYRSKAQRAASYYQIPQTRRDVFLDNDQQEAAISEQLRLAIRKAKETGSALAIGHPYQATFNVLKRQLPELERHGVVLVSVAELIRFRNKQFLTKQEH